MKRLPARRARLRPRPGSSQARQPSALGWLFVLSTAAAGGCLYDEDSACSDRQQLYNKSRCVCAQGTVWTPEGCVECGAHSTAGDVECVCDDGFARATPDAPCTQTSSSQGAPCSDELPCEDLDFDYCQRASSGAAYCTTQGCETSSDCEGDYACDEGAEPPYCKRPPPGQGAPCESDGDCAGGAATYCETLQSHACLVEGCTVGGDDCFIGWSCCDLSGFGLPRLCVSDGTCPL